MKKRSRSTDIFWKKTTISELLSIVFWIVMLFYALIYLQTITEPPCDFHSVMSEPRVKVLEVG